MYIQNESCTIVQKYLGLQGMLSALDPGYDHMVLFDVLTGWCLRFVGAVIHTECDAQNHEIVYVDVKVYLSLYPGDVLNYAISWYTIYGKS